MLTEELKVEREALWETWIELGAHATTLRYIIQNAEATERVPVTVQELETWKAGAISVIEMLLQLVEGTEAHIRESWTDRVPF